MSFLLLDANVIISLHEFGLWAGFVSQNKIAICSTVINEALHYYDPATDSKINIDLSPQVSNGSIVELSANLQDQAKILSELQKYTNAPIIHAGELESLAILKRDVEKEILFCSCDGASIIALAMLKLGHKGISFEKALKKGGMSRKKLALKHTEEYFKKKITEGTLNLI